MITERDLCRLLAWLSPSFPVGAYAYSHGIEYAVEAELVCDRETFCHWVAAIVRHGAGRIDADLLRDAWRAADVGDDAALRQVAARGAAMRGSAEMALESAAQGQAFADTIAAAWPEAGAEGALRVLRDGDAQPVHAVAVGAVAGAVGISLNPTLVGYLHAFAANLVSAGVRLIPLGQTAAQSVLATLEEVVLAAADAALARTEAEFGAAAPLVDWTSMHHETQYTRLFRS